MSNWTSIDVLQLPIYLEAKEVSKLQEQDSAMVFASLEAEPAMDSKYYPEATMRLATDLIASEYQRQKGLGYDNKEIAHVVAVMTTFGVPFHEEGVKPFLL